MKEQSHAKSSVPPHQILDSFATDVSQGRVIGSKTPSGCLRRGIDVERQITIDQQALRLRPLVKPGWAKQGIAYGPYNRQNGLTLAVFLLNGHNTSQSGSILQSLSVRSLNWALGLPEPGRVRWRLLRRLGRWIGSEQPLAILRKLQCWAASTPERFQPPELNHNLAVGWFPEFVPADPLSQGNAFIVHALGETNGELQTRVGQRCQPAFQGLQNLQTYYIVMLRQQGAVYYAASLPQAHGLAAYPFIRPIAVDPFNCDKIIYAAVYQSVLGQIGFMVDTRVYGVHVELLTRFAAWYGTAHAADALTGEGGLDQAELGGDWIVQGDAERTAAGMQLAGLAVLQPNAPSGLVHALLTTAATITPVYLIWRFQDHDHFWSLHLSDQKVQLLCRMGVDATIASSSNWRLQPNCRYSVQLLDDGNQFSLYLNGELLFNQWFSDQRLEAATGVGLGAAAANSARFTDFEAHPRQIPLPAELDLGAPWAAAGQQTLVADTFETPGELQGSKTTIGSQVWQKQMGQGAIECIGNHTAKVRASVQSPNPDRTAYTVAWANPELADVQVEITPPGTARGQAEEGRAGLIFWQDERNYIILNNWLNNDYGGASVSSFFTIRDFEDLYDAVWTNIGDRIHWGVPHLFRVVFDGNRYLVFINDEPVLYRALTDVYPNTARLIIRRVGIVANWEWGDDTGSCFRQFIAKG